MSTHRENPTPPASRARRAAGGAVASAAGSAVVVVGALLLLGATPAARQVFAPVWTQAVVQTGPCILSVILPASEAERCTGWTRRESAGPAFHDRLGVVVVGGSDKLVKGVDAHDGKILWRTPVRGAVMAQPALAGDTAFMGTDDALVVAIDVASGRIRWETPVDAEVLEPAVVHGDTAYIVTGADTTFALDRTTGEARWVNKHPLPRGITLRGQAKPLPLDVARPGGGAFEWLVVGHASGRLAFLDRATGAAAAEIDLSRDDSFGDLDADPLLHDGRIIAASHTRGVFALEPVSKREVWLLREPGIVRLASGGPSLIVAAGAGKVLGVDARTGVVRWRFTFERGAPTRILVRGGRVHVGSDRGALYVLNLFSGRPLQHLGTGSGVAADPWLWQDMLFFTSSAGHLVAASSAWSGHFSPNRNPAGRKSDKTRWPR